MFPYGAEDWTLLNADTTVLRVKLLRKIFGPVQVGYEFRIRYKSELYEPCRSSGRGLSGEDHGRNLNRGYPVIDWCDQLP